MITIEAQDFVRQKKVNWKVWYFIDFTSFVLWLPCSLRWHIREASNLMLNIALSPLLQKRVNLVAMAAKELGNWGRDSKHDIEQWCHCHRKHQSHQFPLAATEPRSTKCSQRCTRKEVVSGQVLLFKSRTQHQPYQWKLQQQNVGQRSPMDCRRNTHQHKGRQQCTCWQVLSLVWEVHKTTSFTATQRKVLEGCSLGYVGWWLSDDVCRATKNQFEIFCSNLQLRGTPLETKDTCEIIKIMIGLQL